LCFVELDESEHEEKPCFADAATPFELDRPLLRQAEEMLELVARDPLTILRRQEIAHKVFSVFRAAMLAAGRTEQKYYCSLTVAMGNALGIFAEIFALSFFLQIHKAAGIYGRILRVCLDSRDISAQNKYFVLTQSKLVPLGGREAAEGKLLALETKLFGDICRDFVEITRDAMGGLAGYEPDPDSVLVLVSQFLNYSHPESRYALELCKFFLEKGKKVCLLNTCEFITQNARLPFFEMSQGVILTEYTNSNNISYEGANIPFAQMMYPMPNIGGIEGIAELAEHVRPGLVVSLSDLSVAAAVLNRYAKTVFAPLKKESPAVLSSGRLALRAASLSDELKNFYRENAVSLLDAGEDIAMENLENADFFSRLAGLLLAQ
jgi:hypothetical protein